MTERYSLREAQTYLQKLIADAQHGKTVLILDENDQAVQLVPVAIASKPRKAGSAQGQIKMSADFDAPMIARLVEYCEHTLPLADTKLPNEYYYHSLPLCVIDAVFSIGVRYEAVEKTVQRFCTRFGLQRISNPRFSDAGKQLSVEQFLTLCDEYGVERMANEIYQNRQRTSSRNGILKAEASLRYAQVLRQFNVNYLQDAVKIIGNPDFETAISAIPGQASGISTRYFYMLVGSDDYIKPDRMIMRFINDALQLSLSIQDSHKVIVAGAEQLKLRYPNLTPRLLDYAIWNYQRKPRARPMDTASEHI
jgi:antitoxin (DNA-binding transcriptional repressor) of toxin-antitoxin stability system